VSGGSGAGLRICFLLRHKALLSTFRLVSEVLFLYTHRLEWTYWESFYFVFITTATIGFGDFVPVSAAGRCAWRCVVVFQPAPVNSLSHTCLSPLSEL
jgi:hypothetical protein